MYMYAHTKQNHVCLKAYIKLNTCMISDRTAFNVVVLGYEGMQKILHFFFTFLAVSVCFAVIVFAVRRNELFFGKAFTLHFAYGFSIFGMLATATAGLFFVLELRKIKWKFYYFPKPRILFAVVTFDIHFSLKILLFALYMQRKAYCVTLLYNGRWVWKTV